MARIIVADAGPVIALAGIAQLDLLRKLFGQVVLTEAVRDECLAKPGKDTAFIEAGLSEGWLQLSENSGAAKTELLSPALGAGESEVICLAMQRPEQTLLIVDDRLARRHALRLKLKIIGTVRLLVLAQDSGFIVDAQQQVEALAVIGYRVSAKLLEQIRQQTGKAG